ncbi:MAG TPA: A/G-specific adenine glycosylase, partial [Flavitalea sp.]|nr:A/G-specific adenine glycosylase [Flavitalea sp.]
MNSSFRDKLLVWNKSTNKRSMPWKGEKDPYKIWLSEIILQQTRVEQGLSYYHSFITVFPTVHDLANAPEEKVFKLWEGLGYYSRCKNLLASAKIISNELNGLFPDTYEKIKLLKGVGPYTASAIACFAFNQPHAVVDGNVQRVLARYFGITTPIDTSSGKKLYQELATSLLDKKQPGVYNQAIMDFGAIICKPSNPLCEQCPQQQDCEAFKNDLIRQLPVKEKKLVKKHRWFYYFKIQSPETVFIRKRTEKDIWQNLHEFALYETNDPSPFPHQPFLKGLLGAQPYAIISQSRVYIQQLTHQTIHGQFIEVSTPEDVFLPPPFQKVNKRELSGLAFPKM